jgi:hypothetical protein
LPGKTIAVKVRSDRLICFRPDKRGRSRNSRASGPSLAVSVFAVSVSAASAGSDESITTKHGSAAFIDSGETLIANDKSKDRFSVMASLTWKEGKKGRSATVRDGNGPGNTPNSRNLGIREGTRVHLKLCYVNNGVVFKCSKAQAATA